MSNVYSISYTKFGSTNSMEQSINSSVLSTSNKPLLVPIPSRFCFSLTLYFVVVPVGSSESLIDSGGSYSFTNSAWLKFRVSSSNRSASSLNDVQKGSPSAVLNSFCNSRGQIIN